MTVREAVPDDATAIAQIAEAAFPLSCPIDTPPQLIAAHVEREFQPEAIEEQICGQCLEVFVGPADARLEGFVIAEIVVAPDEPRTLEVHRLHVLPNAHGTGLAAALLEAALNAGRSRGARRALLGVSGENIPEIRFYQQHGFKSVGGRCLLLGDQTLNDVTMACEL